MSISEQKKHFQFLIIGSGLAGLALADALLKSEIPGEQICILESKQFEEGSSKAPTVLLNPLPGRTLSPKPGAIEAHKFALDWYKPWQGQAVQQIKLLRLLQPKDKVSRRLLRSYEKSKDSFGEEIQVELQSDRSKMESPELFPFAEAALSVSPSLAIELSILLPKLLQQLLSQKVNIQFGAEVKSISKNAEGFLISKTQQKLTAKQIIFASGYKLSEWFPKLPFIPTGGALVVLRHPKSLQVPAFSTRGHLVTAPNGDWVIGSTFNERCFEQPENIDPAQELIARLSLVFPRIKEAKTVRTWFGVRAVIHPDRQSLFGPIPGIEGAFTLGGFASKGMLYIPWAANLLSQHILGHKQELPAATSTNRFTQEMWELTSSLR